MIKSLLIPSLLCLFQNHAIQSESKIQEENKIQECVFRYMFNNNGSEIKGKAVAHFVSIKENDPSEGFIHRFTHDITPVKPASKSTVSEGYLMPVIDSETKKEGLLFNISVIKWKSPTRVIVNAGYRHNGRAAADYRFVVRKTGNIWKVTKQTITMIS